MQLTQQLQLSLFTLALASFFTLFSSIIWYLLLLNIEWAIFVCFIYSIIDLSSGTRQEKMDKVCSWCGPYINLIALWKWKSKWSSTHAWNYDSPTDIRLLKNEKKKRKKEILSFLYYNLNLFIKVLINLLFTHCNCILFTIHIYFPLTGFQTMISAFN